MSVLELEENVSRLSKSERLQMMEVLWHSLRDDEPQSPAWHGEIIAARLAKEEAGKAEFLTLTELKERLRL
jgi:putative addiction module component (TIGR02574 family)